MEIALIQKTIPLQKNEKVKKKGKGFDLGIATENQIVTTQQLIAMTIVEHLIDCQHSTKEQSYELCDQTLDILSQLQQSLLQGILKESSLNSLKKKIQEFPSINPSLQVIADAIHTRGLVELAKLDLLQKSLGKVKNV